ncbi:hypothetical protein EVAR_98753_1 [Eumeta japonica]|uniref:Mos1 transposase HTH domain-containing protein n=1 Tax=Eumeta variegata TaxID=151549 RepID=A0A4C1YXC0_EUMVA|nr:hypothetical protein EVAR_98753_1 [Eumeta japonica]
MYYSFNSITAVAVADRSVCRLRNRSESSNLSNIEHRAVIKYFVKKGKTPKEILKTWYQFFRNLRLAAYDDQKWVSYFKDERVVKMIPSGRPVTVVTEENVRKIENLAYRRILWQIAKELQISKNELINHKRAYEYEKKSVRVEHQNANAV